MPRIAERVTAVSPICRRGWAAISIRRSACSTTSTSSAACSGRVRPSEERASTFSCRRQVWELIDSIRARRPAMSVIVATAYMDEASRFDWLAAMDDGKVIARGAPKEILAKAQKTTLDDAFIALLPPEKRAQHQEVIVRPRTISADETPAIEADDLTRRFGSFVAVDHVSFRIARGEIFGFLGSNGSGKTTTMKMLTGLLPATEG